MEERETQLRHLRCTNYQSGRNNQKITQKCEHTHEHRNIGTHAWAWPSHGHTHMVYSNFQTQKIRIK